MNDQAFSDLKHQCTEAGQADKKDGLQFVPFQSERFKGLIQGLSYKQQQVMVTEYAVGYRGYRLDITKLPGMFADKAYSRNNS